MATDDAGDGGNAEELLDGVGDPSCDLRALYSSCVRRRAASNADELYGARLGHIRPG